jgi:hypothetical protein
MQADAAGWLAPACVGAFLMSMPVKTKAFGVPPKAPLDRVMGIRKAVMFNVCMASIFWPDPTG